LIEVFRARSAAEADLEVGALLLADIRAIFLGHSALKMSSADICKRLGDLEDRPWPEWRRGKSMTPPQLARALRPFGLRPGTVRLAETINGSITIKGYIKEAFEEAWSRYLPARAETQHAPKEEGFNPSHRHTSGMPPDSGENGPVSNSDCNGSGNRFKPADNQARDGVTAPIPPPKGNGVSDGQDEVVI